MFSVQFCKNKWSNYIVYSYSHFINFNLLFLHVLFPIDAIFNNYKDLHFCLGDIIMFFVLKKKKKLKKSRVLDCENCLFLSCVPFAFILYKVILLNKCLYDINHHDPSKLNYIIYLFVYNIYYYSTATRELYVLVLKRFLTCFVYFFFFALGHIMLCNIRLRYLAQTLTIYLDKTRCNIMFIDVHLLFVKEKFFVFKHFFPFIFMKLYTYIYNIYIYDYMNT
ncbi:hypothetical protein AGLY_005574 [Aphis glycines]|uniref:Uncharacterized protein n=1 Tax=Aphis glycines TaxID=307491 RepID=A0A6G0TTB3_APHGL|nr:hypothetical protein AGLY_005574 [Aphis glycines]